MADAETKSVTLPVLGMTCASCQHHVEEALRSTAGVESARVDLMGHRATVVFDPGKAAPDTMPCCRGQERMARDTIMAKLRSPRARLG